MEGEEHDTYQEDEATMTYQSEGSPAEGGSKPEPESYQTADSSPENVPSQCSDDQRPYPVTIYTEAFSLPLRPTGRKTFIQCKPTTNKSAYDECSDCVCGFGDINQLQKHLLSHSQQEQSHAEAEVVSLLSEPDEPDQGEVKPFEIVPKEPTVPHIPKKRKRARKTKTKSQIKSATTREKKKTPPPPPPPPPPTSVPCKVNLPPTSIPTMGSVPLLPGSKIVKVLTLTPEMLKQIAPSLIPEKGTTKIMFSAKGLPKSFVKMAGSGQNSTPVSNATVQETISKVSTLTNPAKGGQNTTKSGQNTTKSGQDTVVISQQSATHTNTNIPCDGQQPHLSGQGSQQTANTIQEAHAIAANVLLNDVTFCQICRSVFRSAVSYVNHLSGFHKRPVKDGVRCEVCAKLFTDPDALVKHIHPCCPNGLTYQCRKCDIAFASVAQLREHLPIHTNKYEWQCIFCSENFRTMSELTGHKLRLHIEEGAAARRISVEKEFLARGVGKSKREQTGRRSKNAERPLHLCDVCGYSTVYIQALNSHMKRHMGVRDFVCEYCDKGFFTSTTLTCHRRRHTGEKPFECQQCPKAFTSKSSLRLHLRFHNDVRPHVCDICGKAFHTGQNMRVHRQRHQTSSEGNSEEPGPKKGAKKKGKVDND